MYRVFQQSQALSLPCLHKTYLDAFVEVGDLLASNKWLCAHDTFVIQSLDDLLLCFPPEAVPLTRNLSNFPFHPNDSQLHSQCMTIRTNPSICYINYLLGHTNDKGVSLASPSSFCGCSISPTSSPNVSSPVDPPGSKHSTIASGSLLFPTHENTPERYTTNMLQKRS